MYAIPIVNSSLKFLFIYVHLYMILIMNLYLVSNAQHQQQFMVTKHFIFIELYRNG